MVYVELVFSLQAHSVGFIKLVLIEVIFVFSVILSSKFGRAFQVSKICGCKKIKNYVCFVWVCYNIPQVFNILFKAFFFSFLSKRLF